jgi:hypothetical protein
MKATIFMQAEMIKQIVQSQNLDIRYFKKQNPKKGIFEKNYFRGTRK